jgi:hypothetical protein
MGRPDELWGSSWQYQDVAARNWFGEPAPFILRRKDHGLRVARTLTQQLQHRKDKTDEPRS